MINHSADFEEERPINHVDGHQADSIIAHPHIVEGKVNEYFKLILSLLMHVRIPVLCRLNFFYPLYSLITHLRGEGKVLLRPCGTTEHLYEI